MFHVRMTDRFLSGWGAAAGARNVLVVSCSTAEEAEAIRLAALDRREMTRVRVCSSPPRERAGVVLSRRSFDEMRGPWRAYFRGERTSP
jgi:hypothetical protein